MAPAGWQESGWKRDSGGQEPEVGDLRWKRGRAPTFLSKVSPFLEVNGGTLCANTFS